MPQQINSSILEEPELPTEHAESSYSLTWQVVLVIHEPPVASEFTDLWQSTLAIICRAGGMTVRPLRLPLPAAPCAIAVKSDALVKLTCQVTV